MGGVGDRVGGSLASPILPSASNSDQGPAMLVRPTHDSSSNDGRPLALCRRPKARDVMRAYEKISDSWRRAKVKA
jgi:hypothetical protein